MEKKVIRKYFSLADFLEEQDFLEKQHKAGWKFKELKGINKYIFEKTDECDFIYQLDVIANSSDEEAYLQMYEDYGWEYASKYDNWYYFRKPKTGNNVDEQLFSDSASKFEMIKRSIQQQLTIVFIFLILAALWIFVLRADNLVSQILEILFFALFIFQAFIASKNFYKYHNLIKDIENPLDGKM